MIIGIGVSLVFDLTKLKSDDIFRIGDKVEQQIEDRDDFEKSKKNALKARVLQAIIERDRDKLHQIAQLLEVVGSDIEPLLPPDTTTIGSSDPSKTDGVETSVKGTAYFEAVTNSSSGEFRHYEQFNIDQEVYVLIKSDAEINQLEIDWDEGSGFETVSAKSRHNQDYYYSSHQYRPAQSPIRNIKIRAKDKQGATYADELLVFIN